MAAVDTPIVKIRRKTKKQPTGKEILDESATKAPAKKAPAKK